MAATGPLALCQKDMGVSRLRDARTKGRLAHTRDDALRDTILFISTLASAPFGASEELWTRTAALLARRGIPIAVSVRSWPQLDRRIGELASIGVKLRLRPYKRSLVSRARRYISGREATVLEIDRSFGKSSPRLVCISNASPDPPVGLVEMCIAKGWPFATLEHGLNVTAWPSDDVAARLRSALPQAQRLFFVYEASRALAQRQWGRVFDNAEIVRNPNSVDVDLPIAWPSMAPAQELRMACVGRLVAGIKGQDVLLDSLASRHWEERSWRLKFYGDGMNRDVLERLTYALKLEKRVSFAGHVAVERIWRENHVLILPSRSENMPLTVIEAMSCGRPVVATNVGGVSEVIKDNITGFLAEAAVVKDLNDALERMWLQRHRLQEIGRLAAESIQEVMSCDPVETFAKTLLSLTKSSKLVERPSTYQFPDAHSR